LIITRGCVFLYDDQMRPLTTSSPLLGATTSAVSIIAIIGAVIVLLGLLAIVVSRRRKAKQDAAYFASFDLSTPLAPSERPDMERIVFAPPVAEVLGQSEEKTTVPVIAPTPLLTPPDSSAATATAEGVVAPPSDVDEAAKALAELDRLLGTSETP